MLDIGCGAGFVIDQLRDTFDEIHGIDATRAMLDRVDTSCGNITLHEGVAETLPFEDGTFDLVTAYSVLPPPRGPPARAGRGAASATQGRRPLRRPRAEPSFWQRDRRASSVRRDVAGLDEIVAREIRAVHHIEEDVHERFAHRAGVFRAAEYIKANLGGFDAERVRAATRATRASAPARRPTNGSSAREP